MKLIIPVLINILVTIGIYLLKKKGKFNKISPLKAQIIIGVCFGLVASFSSSFGVEVLGVVVNVRDASPIIAGLVFGPTAGIVAGFIGGIYRALSIMWGAGTYTVVACTISTIAAGITAALLRKYMFENKRPTIAYAVGITVVLEVFHMLMIFITNFNDANTAFLFIKECTILMIAFNCIAVGLSTFILSLISKEFKLKKEKKEKGIADTFQIWLFISIIIAFFVTSTFTYNLQTGMNDKKLEETFSVAIKDVASDILEESDQQLIEIVHKVKKEYVKNPDVDLNTLLVGDDYEISEINIIDSEGYIIRTTDYRNLYYDMNLSDQSKEFLKLRNQYTENTLVQKYQPNGYGLFRKYAGISLSNGGFLQVGYDATQFHDELDEIIVASTKNRHVGAKGFLVVCNEKFNIVTSISSNYYGKNISSIGIKVNEEMQNNLPASTVYTENIININSGEKEDYSYVYAFSEGYCIIAALPQSEAMLMRDASIYISLFMEVLIFAVLFVLIFYLIKKIIVNNLHKINENLSEITGGNLNVQVDVRGSEEFSSLSDDINSTVSTLKRYIAEAAARIDKELEYAKQIQLSALPTNFPNGDDYSIYASMIAAKEVGGDFYDFYKLGDNHVAFLVADVSGKGIPAAMFMMTAKTIIKYLAEGGMEVNDIFTKANERLCENNESGMFVTAWMGILDLETGLLKYANAGHNPPLILKENGKFEYLRTRAGFILGGMEGVRYRINEIQIQKGDRIFLYTDGVPEATNAHQELYNEDRLLEFMNNYTAMEATELLPSLKANIDEFVGEAPQFDDITMLMFDYKKEKELVVSKTFMAEDSELNNVLGFLEEELEKYECSMKNITAICVAIEEIFVNVAHYAYGTGKGDCDFTIKFNKTTRDLTMVMEDKGTPFNPLAKKDPDVSLPAEQREIGGLGIFIVKKTMDEVSYRYENDKNILTMKKKI